MLVAVGQVHVQVFSALILAARVAFDGAGFLLAVHARFKDVIGVLLDVVVAGGQFQALVGVQVEAELCQHVELAGVGNATLAVRVRRDAVAIGIEDISAFFVGASELVVKGS